MTVKVRVPTPLRKLTNGADTVDAEGKTVGAVFENLEQHYPGFKEHICDEQGQVRRYVNIYVNGDDIRFLSSLETKTNDGDELSIIPAIAGGLRH